MAIDFNDPNFQNNWIKQLQDQYTSYTAAHPTNPDDDPNPDAWWQAMYQPQGGAYNPQQSQPSDYAFDNRYRPYLPVGNGARVNPNEFESNYRDYFNNYATNQTLDQSGNGVYNQGAGKLVERNGLPYWQLDNQIQDRGTNANDSWLNLLGSLVPSIISLGGSAYGSLAGLGEATASTGSTLAADAPYWSMTADAAGVGSGAPSAAAGTVSSGAGAGSSVPWYQSLVDGYNNIPTSLKALGSVGSSLATSGGGDSTAPLADSFSNFNYNAPATSNTGGYNFDSLIPNINGGSSLGNTSATGFGSIADSLTSGGTNAASSLFDQGLSGSNSGDFMKAISDYLKTPSGSGSNGSNLLGGLASYLFGQQQQSNLNNSASNIAFQNNPLNQAQRLPFQQAYTNLMLNPNSYNATPYAQGQQNLANQAFQANVSKYGPSGTQFTDYLKNFQNIQGGDFFKLADQYANAGGYNQNTSNTASSTVPLAQGAAQAGLNSSAGFGKIINDAAPAIGKGFENIFNSLGNSFTTTA